MDEMVYIVTEICDFEYGCTRVCNVFSSEEKALAYIEGQGGNETIPMWTGRYYDKYQIESYIVR